MNIHKSQLFWGSLGTRVLTHPHCGEVNSPGRGLRPAEGAAATAASVAADLFGGQAGGPQPMALKNGDFVPILELKYAGKLEKNIRV